MSQQRNFGLDLLRAAAIGGVFIGHMAGQAARLMIGLDLFFVLSGFLIGRIYFRSTRQENFTIGGFWISRWWRTIPPYYAAVAIYQFTARWLRNEPLSWTYLFFLQNFTGFKGFGQSWSLCVEEHFYLLLPLLALAVDRTLGRRSMVWILPLAFLIPSFLIEAEIHHFCGLNLALVSEHPMNMTPFASQGLIAGVFMAFLFVDKPDWFHDSRKYARWLAWIPLIFLLVIPEYSAWLVSTRALLLAVGFAALLRVVYDLRWQPTTLTGRSIAATVRGIAKVSYSVYLMHLLLNAWLRHYLSTWPTGQFLGAKLAIAFLAFFLPCLPFYFLIEKPSIDSRDRFLKRKERHQLVTP